MKHVQRIFLISLTFLPMIALGAGIIPCGGATEPHCTFDQLIILVEKLINFLLFKISLPLCAILFAYAGFLYLTSGANPAQREQAGSVFKNVFLGFVIALAAWLIVQTILTSLLTDTQYNTYIRGWLRD